MPNITEKSACSDTSTDFVGDVQRSANCEDETTHLASSMFANSAPVDSCDALDRVWLKLLVRSSSSLHKVLVVRDAECSQL